MEKKYTGYGYHGGGRPRKPESEKKKTLAICGTKEEIEKIKQMAAEADMTVSQFVFKKIKEM